MCSDRLSTPLRFLVTSAFIAAFLALTPPAHAASWTILVYMDADNNLEGAGLSDFLEMSSVGSTADVNIVTLFDRIPGYTSLYDDWTGAHRGIIQAGDAPYATWGEDMGELNMANPQTLIDFVTWGVSTYPADRYAIVLWNHGGGWRSKSAELPVKAICWDETSGLDNLTMKEVLGAFEQISTQVGTPELLGFDACYMGMIEVAYELRNYAPFMVGSEESEPFAGWPYDSILGDLVAAPSMGGAELGTIITNRYQEAYPDYNTMAVVDLNQMDHVVECIDELALQLIENWDGQTKVCRSAAEDVVAALDTAILHEQHGESLPGSHGLSIYFPKAGPRDDYSGTTIDFPAVTHWDEFLRVFSTDMVNSWVAASQDQTQYYQMWEHLDVYDFCERVIENSPPDDIQITPATDLTLSGPAGGPFTPETADYTLENIGMTTRPSAAWRAWVDANWVDLGANDSGTLDVGETTELVASINDQANALPAGIYDATLTVSNMIGRQQERHITLRVGVPDYFTELFSDWDFDLENTTLTFTPLDDASGYTETISEATRFPVDPSTCNAVALGDNAYREVELTGNQLFPFYGLARDRYFIGSNGYVTFEEGDVEHVGSETNHFSLPRISALFLDLDPSAGGRVSTKEFLDRVVVTFEDVPRAGFSNCNNFQIEMFFDGVIRITFLRVDSTLGLVGLSRGSGRALDYGESDLNTYSYGSMPASVPLDAENVPVSAWPLLPLLALLGVWAMRSRKPEEALCRVRKERKTRKRSGRF